MVQVPVLEQDTKLKPIGTAGKLNSIGNPYIARTSALDNALMDVTKEAKQSADEAKMIEAQKFYDDWEHQNLNAPDIGAFSRKGKDAFGLPQQYSKKFDDDTQKWAKDNLFNDEQRIAFSKMQASRRGSIIGRLDDYSRSHMDKFYDNESDAATQSSVNRAVENFNNPEIFNSSINNAKAVVMLKAKRDGLSDNDPTVQLQLERAESKAYIGALSRLADTSPKDAVEFYKSNLGKFKGEDLLAASRVIVPTERKYKAKKAAEDVLSTYTPARSQTEQIRFVLNNLEGGAKTVTDGNGAKAQYGINAEHNPDMKVGELTEDQAIARAKEKYWQGLDNVPENLKLIAFDMKFNGWDEKVLGKSIDKAVEEANGDPSALLATRMDYYRKLAEQPEQAKNLEGWTNRLSKLAAQVQAQQGEIPDLYDALKKVDDSTNDIEVAADAKALIKSQIEAMKTTREENWKAASDEAWSFVNDGKEVPASIEARMNPKDVQEMRKAEPDPALYEQLRDQVARGQPVDLGQYRWRLGGKYNELAQLQNDPNKQADARKIDDVMKSGIGFILGGKEPKSTEDFNKIELYRQRLQAELDLIRKERTPTAEDAEKINLRLLQKVKSEGMSDWVSHERSLFEFNPLDQTKLTELRGLPKDRAYSTNDKPLSYEATARMIINDLTSRGLAANEVNVNAYYKWLLGKKLLVEKR